jgi:hypothetical protein
MGETVVNQASHWPVKDFVHSVLPDIRSVVVLAGTPGPTQKITMQLWDKHGVQAYLKYAEKPAAVARLRKEQCMLSALPPGLAPTLLKFGRMGNGVGLLQSPVLGKHLPVRLPPPRDVCTFLQTFSASAPSKIDTHPWIAFQRKQNGFLINRWVDALSSREWPIVVSHGDFVPWNILNTKESDCQAVDWEYGTLEGSPYLDLAYYVLQLGCLLCRWTPHSASDYAINFLVHGAHFDLTEQEARALVGLAACSCLQSFMEDATDATEPKYVWWKAVWEANQ